MCFFRVSFRVSFRFLLSFIFGFFRVSCKVSSEIIYGFCRRFMLFFKISLKLLRFQLGSLFRVPFRIQIGENI